MGGRLATALTRVAGAVVVVVVARAGCTFVVGLIVVVFCPFWKRSACVLSAVIVKFVHVCLSVVVVVVATFGDHACWNDFKFLYIDLSMSTK